MMVELEDKYVRSVGLKRTIYVIGLVSDPCDSILLITICTKLLPQVKKEQDVTHL